MSMQTGSIDADGLARTSDGKLYVTLGTGAAAGLAAAQALGLTYILGKSGVAVTSAADTNENTHATITIPAGALGPNGQLRVSTLWTLTNNANVKTLRVRLGGIAGTQHLAFSAASVATYADQRIIANRNAANSQIGYASTSFGNNVANGTSGAVVTGAIDTASATTIVITSTKVTGSDTVTLESYLVELMYGA